MKLILKMPIGAAALFAIAQFALAPWDKMCRCGRIPPGTIIW